MNALKVSDYNYFKAQVIDAYTKCAMEYHFVNEHAILEYLFDDLVEFLSKENLGYNEAHHRLSREEFFWLLNDREKSHQFVMDVMSILGEGCLSFYNCDDDTFYFMPAKEAW